MLRFGVLGENDRMNPSTVLITGASSGIGRATAAMLAANGFEVFGTTRQPEKLAADAPPIQWIAMDVCDEASVSDGIAQVAQRTKQLDALVCNAGFGIFGSVEEVTIEAAQRQFDTNFFGVLRTLRAVIPSMREARQGRIVLVSSLAARAPIPFQSHYSATKGAIDALAMSLYNELAEFGVHVSLVEPGDINTSFNDATDFGNPQTSAYGDAIRRCEQTVRETLPKAPGPDLVAKTIMRVLGASRPRFRYAVGPDSLGAPFGQRVLPDRLFLRLIRGRFGI
jgi:NAD(P)-dependent dehydrogenase (short-subunit alcohol dehydrogenase family)